MLNMRATKWISSYGNYESNKLILSYSNCESNEMNIKLIIMSETKLILSYGNYESNKMNFYVMVIMSSTKWKKPIKLLHTSTFNELHVFNKGHYTILNHYMESLTLKTQLQGTLCRKVISSSTRGRKIRFKDLSDIGLQS